MPERRFDTGYWNDPDIMKMPMKVKLLYLYLWTNRHCNQAGLYEIALETIQWETGLGLDELPDLLQSQSLKKKVSWLPEQNLVWVKNFLRRQSQSPKFLTAAAKCLKDISNNGVVDEFISFNAERGLVIPYQYPIDRVSIPLYSYAYAYAYANANALSKVVVSLFGSFSLLRDRLRGAAAGSVDRLVEHERIKQELAQIGHEQGLDVQSEWQTHDGRIDLCWIDSDGRVVAAFEIDFYQLKEKSLVKLKALDCPIRCIILRKGESPYHLEQDIHVIGLNIGEEEENLSGDQEIISVWRGVERFVMELPAMVELIKKIRADFPDVDILAESRKWAVSKLAYPLGKVSNCSGQIYNFMAKRHEWNKEQKSRDHKGYPQVRCKCGYTGPDVGHTTCPVCHQPYEKGK